MRSNESSQKKIEVYFLVVGYRTNTHKQTYIQINIMVRTQTDTQKIKDLNTKMTDYTVFGTANSISISSDFQRGDEESGVWTNEGKKLYIDSLRSNYPTGILTMVRSAAHDGDPPLPWNTLDGGNRLRAIRDFLADKLIIKFSGLTVEQQADFKNEALSCQWITIQANDPADTIAKMFTRLNTSSTPLSQGELYKAHGWQKDVWHIEMAKLMVDDVWNTSFENEQISEVSRRWSTVMGDLGETKRSDNLPMMIGYIISAKTGKLTNFDKRYEKNVGLLSVAGTQPTADEISNIVRKFNTFLDVIAEVGNGKTFGISKKGLKPRKTVGPLWMWVVGDRVVPSREKIVRFYKKMGADSTARLAPLNKGYTDILCAGGNNELSAKKIEGALEYILNAVL